jgi:hypothetical protein
MGVPQTVKKAGPSKMKSFKQFKSLTEGQPSPTQMDRAFVTDAENKPLNYAKHFSLIKQ